MPFSIRLKFEQRRHSDRASLKGVCKTSGSMVSGLNICCLRDAETVDFTNIDLDHYASCNRFSCIVMSTLIDHSEAKNKQFQKNFNILKHFRNIVLTE